MMGNKTKEERRTGGRGGGKKMKWRKKDEEKLFLSFASQLLRTPPRFLPSLPFYCSLLLNLPSFASLAPAGPIANSASEHCR